MLDEVSKLIGLGVYTPKGIFVGNVDNIVFDIRNRKIDGLFLQNTNPFLIEKGMMASIPYRWVKSVGDIIILKAFPEKVVIDSE